MIFCGREHVARGKPAPDLYLHAADALGVPIGRIAIIEDLPVGVEGALASGATVIGLVAGRHCLPGHEERLRALGVHHIARDFDEVASAARLELVPAPVALGGEIGAVVLAFASLQRHLLNHFDPFRLDQLFLGPVQHGLAVKADDVDVVEAHPVLRGKGGHRLGMCRCDDPLGLAQAAGPSRAIRQVGGLVQRLSQQDALRISIGPVSGRSERITRRPSVSIKATSTPSSEVPLIRPSAVSIISNRAFAAPCSNRPADDDQLVPNTDIL